MLDEAATVTLTYIGAQVAHKVATESIQAIWDKFADRFRTRFKKTPSTATTAEAAEVLKDPELTAGLAAVLAGSPSLRRAQAMSHVIRGARLLWVDDVPPNNDWECVRVKLEGRW